MQLALSPLTLSTMQGTAEGWLSRLVHANAKEIREVYVCGQCLERHDWEQDAQSCCAPEVESVYECPHCDETHDDRQSAIQCCTAGERMNRLICPVCAKKQNSAHEAADCCLWKDTTPHQRYLMAPRLEQVPSTTWQEAIQYAMSQPQPT